MKWKSVGSERCWIGSPSTVWKLRMAGISLEQLRRELAEFAKERDWDPAEIKSALHFDMMFQGSPTTTHLFALDL